MEQSIILDIKVTLNMIFTSSQMRRILWGGVCKTAGNLLFSATSTKLVIQHAWCFPGALEEQLCFMFINVLVYVYKQILNNPLVKKVCLWFFSYHNWGNLILILKYIWCSIFFFLETACSFEEWDRNQNEE